MIESLFRSTPLEDLTAQVEEKVQTISDRLKEEQRATVKIGIDFPKHFTQQSQTIVDGVVQWRKFFCDDEKGIYSIHCRMDKGAAIREHCHPDATEYIYVVNGGIINWRANAFTGDLISPPERVSKCASETTNNVSGWYEIPPGQLHHLQATEDDTHFISKFILAE
jgi:hypothetical protein